MKSQKLFTAYVFVVFGMIRSIYTPSLEKSMGTEIIQQNQSFVAIVYK